MDSSLLPSISSEPSSHRTHETTSNHPVQSLEGLTSAPLCKIQTNGTGKYESLDESDTLQNSCASDHNSHHLTVEERLQRESSFSDLKLLLNFAKTAFRHSPPIDTEDDGNIPTNQNALSEALPVVSQEANKNDNSHENGTISSRTLDDASAPVSKPPSLPISSTKTKYTALKPMRMTVLSDFPLGTSFAYNMGHPVPLPYMSSSIPAGPDSVKTLKKDMKKMKFSFKRLAAESAKRTWSDAMAISRLSDNILNPDHKKDQAQLDAKFSSYIDRNLKKLKPLASTTTRSGRETKPSNKVAADHLFEMEQSQDVQTEVDKSEDNSSKEKKGRGPGNLKLKDRKPKDSSGYIRGVTQRPSGKWQAQLYFAGKSRYIGVFDSREKANLGYEIAREFLHIHAKDIRTIDAETYMNQARQMAFEGVKEFVAEPDSYPVCTKIIHAQPMIRHAEPSKHDESSIKHFEPNIERTESSIEHAEPNVEHAEPETVVDQNHGGVTQRASGKWQAQLYFAGKSRYIGVFDSREKAILGYDITKEYLNSHANDIPTIDAETFMNQARQMAFEGVKEFVAEPDSHPVCTENSHVEPIVKLAEATSVTELKS